MKRLLLLSSMLLALTAAAGPADVVAELEEQGYYIEAGSSASADVVGDAVAEAGFAGSRLYAVVLADEPTSGATFYADAVLDDLGDGTVLVVAPETVGWVSDGDVWTDEQLDAAVDASVNGSTDDDVVTLFVQSLTGAQPAPDSGSDDGSGGGGTGWIWFLVIGGGFVLLFLFLRNRSNATAATARDARLREFYTAAQAKLDAIANDIIEMESEVALAENSDVTAHYESASATYAELVDQVPKATSADDLVDIAFKLDVAIWELDVAEALLDGKPAPGRPEKPVVEVPEDRPPVLEPAPRVDDFQRRSQRQASPAGPDLGNILLAILAAQGLGGRGGGTWGQPGSNPGPSGFPSGPGGGGGRMRGGGRRRG
jgi:hypothetical protein